MAIRSSNKKFQTDFWTEYKKTHYVTSHDLHHQNNWKKYYAIIFQNYFIQFSYATTLKVELLDNNFYDLLTILDGQFKENKQA